MTNFPTVPTLPEDLIASFYKQVSDFYELAPWELMGDSEYFGVLKWKELNETNNPIEVQIIFNQANLLIEEYTGMQIKTD